MSIFTKKRFRSGLVSVSVLLSVLGSDVYAQKTPAGDAGLRRNERDNAPKSINLPVDAKYSPDDAQAIFSKYLDINPATDKMVFGNTTNNKMGVTIDRYWQYFKGIKIDRAAYTVYAKDGRVNFLTGNFYKTNPNLSATPGLTETQAFNKAITAIGAQKYMWQDGAEENALKEIENNPAATYFPKGTLVFIEKLDDGQWDGKLHLAYSFDIYAQQPLSRDVVYVDATNGEILYKNPRIKHTAATGNSRYSATIPMTTGHVGVNYYLNDSARNVYTYNCNNSTSYANTNFVSSVLNWVTVNEGIDAHWGAEMVYDYWQTQGRNSYNNAGAAIRSYVHYDVNYNNAFWDGSRMTYGDGTGSGNGGFDPLTCIDVCGHEIGHAVCEYTSNLDYTGQSGGMNEGFSDIWGAVIETWANPNEIDATPKDTWTVGEEITAGGFGLRSMNNPNSHGDPDTYLGTNWVSTVGSCNSGNDYCGVHTNSGVLNKWFYILTVGESGTNDIGSNYNVTGVGMTIAALITYQTEQALVNNSNYADARAAAISVSSALYGPCSAITQSVTDAWYAVGVGPAFVACYPTIGFASTTTSTSEWNNTIVCPSSKTISLPVTVTAAPTGGNATVTVTASGGNAVAGVDYAITGGSLTFPAGSTTTQNAVITIYDNGAINDSKFLTLQLTLNANGSNAQLSTITDTARIDIVNQDNAPLAGSTNVWNVLTANTTSNASSPFQSSFRKVRMQSIYTAAELTAAGVIPNVPISAMALSVITKNSTIPYTGFTVAMANTSLSSFSGFITTGFTQVYSNNYSTVVGWNTLPFSTNFTWDGTSNVVVNFCFNNATNIGSNDVCDGLQIGTPTTFAKSNGTTAGCNITSTTGNSSAKPILRLTQTVPATVIETTSGSSRIWNVRSGTEVYFYSSADSQLVVGMKNMNNNLGCVTGSLTGGGNGFIASTYGGTNRSRKEFTITPSINGSTTTYNGSVYMTTAELNGVAPNSLFLVKTNEPTDATINQSNSTLITPTLATNASFATFSGNFTGFGRYFLTDGPLPPPVPVITPASSTTFCQGGSVQLNGNTGNSVTYKWLLNGVVIPGATANTYLATAGGTYLFIMTNSANVSDTSAPVAVTVNPGPGATATPTGPTTVCAGNSVTMNSNTGLGYTYQWRINSVNLPGATTSSFTASTTGMYTVVVTGSGCSSTSSPVNVVINTNPVANAASNSPVCVGGTLFLNATSAPGCSYSWTGPNAFTSALQNAQIANIQMVNAGDYYLTVTNTTTGCTGMDTVNVTTQNGAPPASPDSIAGVSPVCSGSTNIYSAAPVVGATSYTWSLPTGWSGTSATASINATASTASGNITVTANNSCGSSMPTVYTVMVNASPNSPAVIGSIVYCLNETPAQLTATGSNLLWYDVPTGGVGDVNAPTPVTNVTGITPFYVSQSDGICESQRSIILVTVSALPVVNVVQVGNTFTASGTYPYYQWYLNGVLIVGASTNVYTATQDGDYTVMVSDINSCTYTSDPITIGTTGVNQVATGDPKFYPNPTTGICWLELPNTQSSTEVLITDVTGKLIERAVVKDQKKIQFDLSKVARGVYVVKVITADKTYTSRITLQ